MRLIYGSLLRGEVLSIQRRCGLYTGAANTRVYTVYVLYRYVHYGLDFNWHQCIAASNFLEFEKFWKILFE